MNDNAGGNVGHGQFLCPLCLSGVDPEDESRKTLVGTNDWYHRSCLEEATGWPMSHPAWAMPLVGMVDLAMRVRGLENRHGRAARGVQTP